MSSRNDILICSFEHGKSKEIILHGLNMHVMKVDNYMTHPNLAVSNTIRD